MTAGSAYSAPGASPSATEVVSAKVHATGGSGTGADPWTGWEAGAVAAVAVGGTIEFGAEFFEFDALAITKPCTLAGVGWYSKAEGYFGDASYLNMANHGGTVLVSTALVGDAISYEVTNSQLHIKDLLLVGPGSGTSQGIRVGTSTKYMKYATWQNVRVMNFYQGVDLHLCQDLTVISLSTRGCRSGLRLTDFTNQNVFLDFQCEYSGEADVGGDGLLMALTGAQAASLNRFYGGLFQNIVGRSAWRTEGGCDGNKLDGFWMEGAAAATNAIDIAGGGGNAYEHAWHASNGGSISIASGPFALGPIRAGGAYTITHAGSDSIFRGIGSEATIIDTGLRTTRMNAPAGLSLKAASAESPLVLSSTAGDVAEAIYALFNSRARFGYNGAGPYVDDNGTSKPFTVRLNNGDRLIVGNNGVVSIPTVGGGLNIKEGANGRQGVATLVGGTVTVAHTGITANSRIMLTVQSLGTVADPKPVAVTARVVGTSFTIRSADATDTSVVAYQIFEPA